MGWSSGWNSRKELVDELLTPYARSLPLAHASTKFGRNLWVVVENQNKERFIVLYLIAKSGGTWGYKPIDESMGPVEADCPANLLNLVPEDAENSIGVNKEWRKRVMYRNAGTGHRWLAGDVVDIHGQDYRLVAKYPSGRSWAIERVIDGKRFKSGPSRFILKQAVNA